MEAGARGKTYKIGQAAKLLDVKPFVLRFWEGEFKDVLVPVRTPSGQRAYTEANVELVREIKRLLYDEGLTIEGAKKRLREAKGQHGGQAPDQASHQATGQTPPQVPLAPAAPAQPGHSPEPQHFDGQPALPGLARPERFEAAHAAPAAALTAAQVAADARAQAARQQTARAEQSAAAATARADEAALLADAASARAAAARARAEALTQALTHFRQELLAIRDLLG